MRIAGSMSCRGVVLVRRVVARCHVADVMPIGILRCWVLLYPPHSLAKLVAGDGSDAAPYAFDSLASKRRRRCSRFLLTKYI